MQQEFKVQRVLQEQAVQLEKMAQPAPLVQLEKMAQPDQRVLQVLQDQMARQDPPVEPVITARQV